MRMSGMGGRVTWGAAAATLMLALAACAPGGDAPPQATTAVAQGAAHGPACQLAGSADVLLSLARCCAASLASNPSCRSYGAADGFVIIKDNARDKPAAYLIIPTAMVTGIEDRQIFAPPVVDFWQYGWDAASRYVGEPPAATALAINSAEGRTQNQLHIHISCVRPDVAAALAGARLGADPAHPASLTLAGHRYLAVQVRSLTGDASPFRVAAAMPGVGADMRAQSIAVIGTADPDVWDVVNTTAGGGNPGSAEELLDQSCREPA